MNRGRRRLALTAAVAAAAGLRAHMVGAAPPPGAWPPRHIRLVVAYPAGGLSADIALTLAELLGRALGVPVVVEPRPGAGGVLAIESIARSPGDGTHLVYAAITPLTLAPLMGPLPYDPDRDVQPVIGVVATPVMIVTGLGHDGDGLAALLARARRDPGALRWASSGIGTTGHMVMERIAAVAGVTVTHVPYTGGGRQLVDALGGQFELLSTNLAPAPVQLVQAGRLRALAVTGGRRSASLPDVPTVAELGFATADLSSVFGIFAPGRTPPAIVARLNTALDQALQDPGLHRHALEGEAWLGGPPSRLAEQIRQEREAHRRWRAQANDAPRR